MAAGGKTCKPKSSKIKRSHLRIEVIWRLWGPLALEALRSASRRKVDFEMTRKSRLRASMPRALAKWVFPTPVGPQNNTFSWRWMKAQVARSTMKERFTPGGVGKSKCDRVLAGVAPGGG